jgi:hypothetical protein
VIPFLGYSLELVSAFIGFAIAFIAFKGYRLTTSPTLLRLALSFFFLGFGFSIQGIVGFLGIQISSDAIVLVSTILIIGTLLETIGYFFLAFSHAINALGKRMLVPAVIFVPMAALRTFAIYFLLYTLVETSLSYIKIKKQETLMITIGIGLILISEFTKWLSFFEVSDPLFSVFSLVKVIGLIAIFIPVTKFQLKKGVEKT